MIKVEGEWFGYESFICGPYASMTQEQLLNQSIEKGAEFGNEFRAVAMERCELVVADLNTMFNHVSMQDIMRLHRSFAKALYADHPAFDYLMGKRR